MLSRRLAELLIQKKVSVEAVFMYVKEHGLEALLPQVIKNIQKIELGNTKKKTLRIETPFPLSESAVESVKRLIGENDAPVVITENKDLLAGFIARVRDREYDSSARTIIRNFIRSN